MRGFAQEGKPPHQAALAPTEKQKVDGGLGDGHSDILPLHAVVKHGCVGDGAVGCMDAMVCGEGEVKTSPAAAPSARFFPRKPPKIGS